MTAAPTLRRRMNARFAVALAIALTGAAALAAPAAALEPGVHVDPGSPAAKEYGVPLSQLRQSASGQAPAGAATPPPFGTGISPAGVGPARAATRAARGGRNASGRRGPAAGATAVGTAAGQGGAAGGTLVPGPALAEITHHGSSVPAVALIAGIVVLGGLGIGALLVAAHRRLD